MSTTQTALDGRIEMSPGIVGGKPRVAGRGLSVQHIVISHERVGHSPDEIADHYGLSLPEVYAALTYYFDHREEVDASIRGSEEHVEEMRRRTPSPLERKLRDLDA